MTLVQVITTFIFGILNNHSIVWRIAEVMHEHGTKITSSYVGQLYERRVHTLAESIQCNFVV
jgi:enoyl-[acyl-carrier-protein] reductase (NADH)